MTMTIGHLKYLFVDISRVIQLIGETLVNGAKNCEIVKLLS